MVKGSHKKRNAARKRKMNNEMYKLSKIEYRCMIPMNESYTVNAQIIYKNVEKFPGSNCDDKNNISKNVYSHYASPATILKYLLSKTNE